MSGNIFNSQPSITYLVLHEMNRTWSSRNMNLMTSLTHESDIHSRAVGSILIESSTHLFDQPFIAEHKFLTMYHSSSYSPNCNSWFSPLFLQSFSSNASGRIGKADKMYAVNPSWGTTGNLTWDNLINASGALPMINWRRHLMNPPYALLHLHPNVFSFMIFFRLQFPFLRATGPFKPSL